MKLPQVQTIVLIKFLDINDLLTETKQSMIHSCSFVCMNNYFMIQMANGNIKDQNQH